MLRHPGSQDKKSGKDSSAFRSRMGQQGPKPRLLRLKPEDSALVQVCSPELGSAPQLHSC